MLNTGTFLADRYEILEKIGAGGMSDVYKAKDHVLGREVAVKVLKEEFAEDTGFVSKFRSEAQSAAGLEHPNIVNIYDVGSEDGRYYIVMEYVEGITLKTYIEKKGQLNYKEVISIAIQVGRGIEAAHKKNIIHRDIKPQNIMISKEGKVKVTDFGIAKAASGNTIHADVMGSVHYSSPEQTRNGYVNAQSDIYSLGIVMYEMATGRVPFDGETAVAVAIQHLQGEMTPPTEYAPDLPISMEKIIQKATMKSPDKRYESMADLLTDLKKALINPDEDFVTMINIDEAEKTRIITDEELEQIREETQDPLEGDEEEEDDDSDEKVNPKMEKAITIMGIVAAVIIAAIVIYIIGSAFGLFKFGSSSSDEEETTTEEVAQVEVPDLLGMTEEEAKAALEEAGLGYKNIGTASSDTYEEGTVMDQSVNAGKEVDENTTIKVTFSSGPGDTDIPDVTGMTESAAISALKAAGFKYSTDYEYSDTVESGKVISYSPTGEGQEGDTITIVVSQGQETVQVPDVAGQSQSAAESALSNVGLSASVTTAYSDTVSEGTVISQGTSAGSYVTKGSTVSIVVSLGKEASTYRLSETLPSGYVGNYYVVVDSSGNQLMAGTITTDGQSINKSGLSVSSGTLYIYEDSSKANQLYTTSLTFTEE